MKRHRWGQPDRFLHKTERECIDCGLVKVTHHPPVGFPTKSFWRDAEKLDDARTPACTAGFSTEKDAAKEAA